MVEHERMLGAELALGVTTAPLHALIHGEGSAWRIGGSTFRGALTDTPALQRIVHRYLYVLMAQMATSAACLRYHQIAPRLARRLLMTQDHANNDQIHVT